MVLERGDARLTGREIPVTLHDSLMARLDRVGPAKEVIQVGAVIGGEFTYELLSAVHSLLRDLLSLNSGAPELVRNTDIMADLKTLAGAIDFNWIAQAAQQLGQVQYGARRNVLRPLSLDAFALALEKEK